MSSYGLWLSAAGMKVQQHRQDVYANNLANAATTGFKHDLAVFTQRDIEATEAMSASPLRHPVLDDLAGGVNVRPSQHDFSQGPIEWTGRPLDVAIVGRGFFEVSDGNETRYTRDGEFTVGSTGALVLSAGEGRWRVLDDSGSSLQFEEGGEPPRIGADGTVRQGEVVVGRLSLKDTPDRQRMVKAGTNLFGAGDASMEPIAHLLQPESREESNFNPMQGLVTIIEASRAYQLNATLLQLQDQLSGQAANTVGRLR